MFLYLNKGSFQESNYGFVETLKMACLESLECLSFFCFLCFL